MKLAKHHPELLKLKDSCIIDGNVFELRLTDCGRRVLFMNGEYKSFRQVEDMMELGRGTISSRIEGGHAFEYCIAKKDDPYWIKANKDRSERGVSRSLEARGIKKALHTPLQGAEAFSAKWLMRHM